MEEEAAVEEEAEQHKEEAEEVLAEASFQPLETPRDFSWPNRGTKGTVCS